MECNEADENKPPKRKSEKHGDEPSHYWCSVPGCTSDGRKKANLIKYPWMRGVQFYPYPGAKRKAKLRKRWLQQVFRDEKYAPKRYHSVCSRHFIDGCPTEENPVPTLFPRNKVAKQSRTTTSIEKRQPTNSSSDSATVAETSVHSNKCAPMECLPMEDITVSCEGNAGVHIPLPVAHECVIEQISNETCIKEPCSKTEDISCGKYNHDHIYSKQSVEPRCSEDFVDFAVQTDLTMKDIHHMETMTKETDHIHREHFVNRITQSDSAVRRYLGVPSITMLFGLFAILDKVCTKLKYWSGKKSIANMNYETSEIRKPGPKRKLTRFHEFLLTLLRLRLSVPSFLIGDLFGVSETRVSQIVCTWINYMFQVFKPQLKWPSLQSIRKHMPRSFKQTFPRTRVVIDCTEIFIQKPRTPTAQSQTYSNYKGHNTFKCLVGITPTGAFSYVSELWGGNVSDRYITANSDFLDLISAGDEVMADRGFIIRDYLLERKAKLVIPPFTHKCGWGKGKRLNASEIRRTRQIAKLRIHVERAIQRLKSYKLLSGILPINLKPIASQILVVAAFLCNLSKPLVKN
ncbi:uncharacterized protein LOC134249411 [Saccostrea cucullata]|uniref:uncharacterized protein LOC134249411 n=1 Tax=Saccostrea cuccullata TaxID=36930 RepID=UPI002ED21BA4